jgi:alpha-galactosidase
MSICNPRRVALLLCLSSMAVVPRGRAQQLLDGNDFAFKDCYARRNGAELVMGNTHVRRTWRIEGARLFATSFFDLDTKTEWIDLPPALPSPTPPMPMPVASGQLMLRGAGGTFGPTEAPSLRVELADTTPGSSVQYEFQVFPASSGIRMWLIQKTGRSAVAAPATKGEPLDDALEHLPIAKPHVGLTQVTMHDQTDYHNELVQEQNWLLQPNEDLLELRGNLFVVEDTLTGDGLIFLKEAPQPEMRPIQSAFDAWFSGSPMSIHANRGPAAKPHFELSFYGNGFSGDGQGYPYVLLAFHGGRNGRTAVLHNYQRQVRQYLPGRDGLLVSNTWGDRSAAAKLDDGFVRKEIDAGKRLGVDLVQIDDGWQTGKSTGTATTGGVWNGFWEKDPNFWSIDAARFPNGLLPLSEYAHERGMKLGLWFAPDSQNDFINANKDGDRLLALHRDEGIDAFKLDTVKIQSKRGEMNYRALLKRVQDDSSGKILIDLDVTAEPRQGYFGNIGAGPIFVENRYTDWHTYWPHQTLRNFWMLAQYVDPIRLRMEFLNSERNPSLYPDDPLAPEKYSPDCLFATTMFGSPLAWFENSGLSPKYVASAAPLIATWKRERDAIYDGQTLPIGDAPDGMSWAGFASQMREGQGGYLLVFRELNPQSNWVAPRSLFAAGEYKIRLLGGDGEVTEAKDGFHVNINHPLGFVFVKLEAVR